MYSITLHKVEKTFQKVLRKISESFLYLCCCKTTEITLHFDDFFIRLIHISVNFFLQKVVIQFCSVFKHRGARKSPHEKKSLVHREYSSLPFDWLTMNFYAFQREFFARQNFLGLLDEETVDDWILKEGGCFLVLEVGETLFKSWWRMNDNVVYFYSCQKEWKRGGPFLAFMLFWLCQTAFFVRNWMIPTKRIFLLSFDILLVFLYQLIS